MARAIRRIGITLFWLVARLVTASVPTGWRPSRKRNDFDFM